MAPETRKLPIGEVAAKRLSDDLLLEYAAGALSGPVHAFVATYLSLNPEAAALVRTGEIVGGAVMDAVPAVPVSAGLRDAVFARIGAESAPAADLEADVIDLPAEIRARAAGQRWQRAMRGLGRISLNRPDEPARPSLNLLRLTPGTGIPTHTHAGGEMIMVLRGGFADEFDSYERGEVSVGDETLLHRPVAVPGEVCYAISLHDAPLRYTGLLGLLQRLTGR